MRKATFWVLLCSLLITCGLWAQRGSKSEMSDRVKSIVGKVTSADVNDQEEAMNGVLEERKELVSALCQIVDQKNADKYPREARQVAAYLLGELRAKEGVDSLSSALEHLRPPRPAMHIPLEVYYGPRSPAVVWGALVKIGRPSMPAMIKNIETSDNRTVRMDSISVLNRVLRGKRRVVELLTKLKARAKDEKKIERIEKALKRVREHYKEDEEPLY